MNIFPKYTRKHSHSGKNMGIIQPSVEVLKNVMHVLIQARKVKPTNVMKQKKIPQGPQPHKRR